MTGKVNSRGGIFVDSIVQATQGGHSSPNGQLRLQYLY